MSKCKQQLADYKNRYKQLQTSKRELLLEKRVLDKTVLEQSLLLDQLDDIIWSTINRLEDNGYTKESTLLKERRSLVQTFISEDIKE